MGSFANTNAKDIGKSVACKSIAFLLEPTVGVKLGDQFGKLITTAELYTASRDPRFADDLGRAVGRARGPKMKMKSIKKAIGCAGPLERSAASTKVWVWALLSSRLSFFSKLRLKDKSIPEVEQQLKETWQDLKAAAASLDAQASASGEAMEITSAETWKRRIHALHACSEDAIKAWIDEAKEVHTTKVCEDARENKQSFVKWQIDQEFNNSLKGQYAWVRKAGETYMNDTETIHQGSVYASNEEACNFRAETWENLWTYRGGSFEDFKKAIDEQWAVLRGACGKESLKDLTMEQLHEAIYTFPKDTGKGSDNVDPAFVKHLPKQAKEELLALFNSIQKEGAWPWQWLHVLIALIPKASGGDRPIGLLNFFIWFFFRMHREGTREWTTEKHGP